MRVIRDPLRCSTLDFLLRHPVCVTMILATLLILSPSTDQCKWCKKYFERKQSKNFTIYDDTNPHCFCSKSCMNVYISNTRHIVPCNWCKVKKYNFDMIRRVQANGQAVMMCSLNCLNLYQVSVNAVSSRK